MLRALGEMLYDGTLGDPRVAMITFTAVQLTDDLRFARVYFSQFGGAKEHQITEKALKRAAPYLKTELTRRLKLRYAPELRFCFDPSLERGARITELLREALPPAPAPEPEPEPTEDEGADD